MVVGTTSLEPHEVQDAVQQLGYEFRGNSYHLLERNCVRPPGQARPAQLLLAARNAPAHAHPPSRSLAWSVAGGMRLVRGTVSGGTERACQSSLVQPQPCLQRGRRQAARQGHRASAQASPPEPCLPGAAQATTSRTRCARS